MLNVQMKEKSTVSIVIKIKRIKSKSRARKTQLCI